MPSRQQLLEVRSGIGKNGLRRLLVGFQKLLARDIGFCVVDGVYRDKTAILPLQAADMLAWLSQRAHAYEFNAAPMPTYAIGVWNKFLLSKRVMAKGQTRQMMADFMAKDPKALVTLPKGWHPQTLKTSRRV